jgi:hypothetical protein
MKGLIIKDPWLTKILNGEKVWEIRGRNTNIRGTIALIKSGTGMIHGSINLVDAFRMSLNDYELNREKHQIQSYGHAGFVYYSTPWVWELENPKLYPEPIPYKHPQGAVIWVNLDNAVIYDR